MMTKIKKEMSESYEIETDCMDGGWETLLHNRQDRPFKGGDVWAGNSMMSRSQQSEELDEGHTKRRTTQTKAWIQEWVPFLGGQIREPVQLEPSEWGQS